MRKKLLRSALALIISVTMLPLGSLVSYAGEETSNIDSKGIATEEIAQSAYSEHIANGTLPSKNGYLFAGWYTDRTCADVLTRTEGAALGTDATVYAKFVDSDALTVKAQVEIKGDGARADIRFVTTVDSVNYQKIGFKIAIEGRDDVKIRESKKVYRNLYQIGEESENSLDVISPKLFSEASTFFCTYGFWNVPKTDFGVGFTVTPYWVTLDGTTVDGTTATKTVNGGYEYSGDWEFDTSYKYICNSSFMYVSGTSEKDYEQPYVENGVLNLSLKTNTRTVCFSAADLIKDGYCAGDDVKVTVRIKPDNAEQFKIYTAPRGTGTNPEFLKEKVNADSDGWYTYTYETEINDKYSAYINGTGTAIADSYANIGFMFQWTSDSLFSTAAQSILIDYIRVQPVSDGWEFTNEDLPLSSDNIFTDATAEIKDGHLKVSVTNTGSNAALCWGYVSLSAQRLIEAGYEVGDSVKVTIRMKTSSPGGTIQFSGAAIGGEWGATKKDLPRDGAYHAWTYETMICEHKGSLWGDNTSDGWNSIRLRFAFDGTVAGDTRDVEIDYIRVEPVSDGWEFTGIDTPFYSEDIRVNGTHDATLKNGKLSMTFSNEWNSVRLSSEKLIEAGYQAGDDVRITMRMKPDTPALCSFYYAPIGSGWTHGETYEVVNDMADADSEGYFTVTYTTKINAQDSNSLFHPDATKTDWGNIGFMFYWAGVSETNTRNVLIDYIKVEPSSGGWEFTCANDTFCAENLHINSTSTVSVKKGKLSVTSSNGWSMIRLSAAELLTAGYSVGDDIQVTMRIKPSAPEKCIFYGKPYGSGWTEGTTAIVVNKMLNDECVIKATVDAEGYYTFTYNTKINEKDCDWLNDGSSSATDWANVGIMFNFSDEEKNVLIDYIRVEKVAATE